MLPSTSTGKTRKRLYRQRIKCTVCGKEIDSDYKDKHNLTNHAGRNVTFIPVHGKSQQKLSSFFEKRSEFNVSEKEGAADEDDITKNCMISHVTRKDSCTDSQKQDITKKPRIATEHETSESEDTSNDEDHTEKDSNTGSPQIDNVESGPNQPILTIYNPQKFGKELRLRDFNSDWFKIHPWITYDVKKMQASCYPCNVFLQNSTFSFKNWKKTHRLSKHAKSSRHKQAMMKWLNYRAHEKQKVSLLGRLNAAHKQQVAQNREYLKIIIETLLFTAKQNIPQRGHEEDRRNLDIDSNINRGNFLELLNLRSKDISWLGEKMKSQLEAQRQWTSPKIQNEILEIMSAVMRDKIVEDVKKSFGYSIIVDETSDICRVEQVAICLRFTMAGETRECFIGFYATPSTEGQVLYELVKNELSRLELNLDNIVGQCFDGAANMSGVKRGLATRMKECSPKSIYVHCYGHLLNLAIQETMSDVEPLRNALGVIQSIYNFIESSPKRHAIFANTTARNDHIMQTLKSQSVTRWSCRFEAVKSVIEQLPDITETLLSLADNKDPRTYTDSTALLNAIADFDFLVGLIILKVILSNTNSLHKYLQGKTVDVITARETASATIQTLASCRNEDSFESVWECAEKLGKKMQQIIEGTRFTFKEAKVPRKKKSLKDY